MSTDRLRIERLVYEYCRLVDHAQIDELVALFMPDAVIDYGFGRLIRGRDQIWDLFAERLAAYQATSHHASNVVIEPSDEGATVECAIYAWHRLRDGSEAEVWGRYSDVVVSDGDRWRLASRRIRAAGWRGFADPPGLPGPFERIDRTELR